MSVDLVPGEVAAYWARVEADTAARRELAAFLIDQLYGKGDDMTLGIRHALRSDIGRVRASNDDSAYAGERLIAVADGLGGRGRGGPASAAVIDALRPLDTGLPARDLLSALDQAVLDADAALRAMTRSDPSLEGMGSTLTAMLWSGSRLSLIHVGDCRAYVLRSGELCQITHDHTYVRRLVDLANDAGGPDNVTCVVADVRDGGEGG